MQVNPVWLIIRDIDILLACPLYGCAFPLQQLDACYSHHNKNKHFPYGYIKAYLNY